MDTLCDNLATVADPYAELQNILLRSYTVKKAFRYSPAGMSLTKHSLRRNYDAIYKLFLPRESLVSDIPAGDGNIEKLYITVYGLSAAQKITQAEGATSLLPEGSSHHPKDRLAGRCHTDISRAGHIALIY